MWVIDAHQLFYIDESGALCHAMSGLAVDVLGMYFSPMITHLYPDPKYKQTMCHFFVVVILYLLVLTLGPIPYQYSPTRNPRFGYTSSAIQQCPSVPRISILTKLGYLMTSSLPHIPRNLCIGIKLLISLPGYREI